MVLYSTSMLISISSIKYCKRFWQNLKDYNSATNGMG